MNTQVVDAVIREQIKALKVPAIARSYVALARQAGESYRQRQRRLDTSTSIIGEEEMRGDSTSQKKVRRCSLPRTRENYSTLDAADWMLLGGGLAFSCYLCVNDSQPTW